MKEIRMFYWEMILLVFCGINSGLVGFYDLFFNEEPRVIYLIVISLVSAFAAFLSYKKYKSFYFKYDNNKVKWLFPHMDKPQEMDIHNIKKVGGISHIITLEKSDGQKELFSVEFLEERLQKKIRRFFESKAR